MTATAIQTPAPVLLSDGPTRVSKEARDALFRRASEAEETLAQVSGTLPAWLQGSLIANGGGDYSGMVHLFDGLAALTKISFHGDGKVSAAQKYITSEQYKYKQSTGKMKWREFATPLSAESTMQKALQVVSNTVALATNGQGFTDNPSVNVIPLQDGNLMALSETISAVYRVRPSDLGTLESVDKQMRGDKVPGQLITAHPKLLKGGKQLVNFARSLPMGGFHVFLQDTMSLERKEIAFIKDHNPVAPSWVHDFGATSKHAVILETPLLFNMPSLMFGFEREYIMMDWKPEMRTRVHVVALDGSGVKTYTAPPLFTFHHINAFEDGDTLNVDFAGYEGPQIMKDLLLTSLYEFPGNDVSRSYVQRLSIPLSKPGTELGAPKNLIKDPSSHGSFCDFPGVSSAVRGGKYQYAYCLAAVRPTNMGNALAKHDVMEGTSVMWHEPGSMAGEPHFIARPGGSGEDDGVVISIVMGADGFSFLLVLDAKSWTEVARARLPFAVPYRFHAAFLPGLQPGQGGPSASS